MNEIIDNEVNTIFDEIINKNLDAYLDFHYSIIGSYTELFTMAFDTNPEKILMEKLHQKLILKLRWQIVFLL